MLVSFLDKSIKCVGNIYSHQYRRIDYERNNLIDRITINYIVIQHCVVLSSNNYVFSFTLHPLDIDLF